MESSIRPKVRLTGTDGNVFNIIGLVSRSLKGYGNTLEERAEGQRLAREFTAKAFAAKSYEEVLQLAATYCEVS